MSAPEQHVSILQAEMRRLEAFLGTLAYEDWQRSSRCDQWTVADVVAHLTAMDQDCTARIVRALHGDASPPPQAPPIAGQAAADIAHHRCAAAQLGNDLLPTFSAAQSALHETLATIGPADWDKPCYHPQGSVSIGWLVDALINERIIHGWDIQSVFDPHTRLSPACLPMMVERNAQRRRWRKAPSDAAGQHRRSAIGLKSQAFLDRTDVAHRRATIHGSGGQRLQTSRSAVMGRLSSC